MNTQAESIARVLARGPTTAASLGHALGVSQPTVSRALSRLGGNVIRLGSSRSSRYAWRDESRGLPSVPVYRVDTEGRIAHLGELIPVKPEGFVMIASDGQRLHSEGLPWWLQDMRPQGFLGRTFAAAHAYALGLPADVRDWDDTHTLRALLVHGDEAVGNLLLGDLARDRFLQSGPPPVIEEDQVGAAYEAAAQVAEAGLWAGSSAAGEQPKFTAVVRRNHRDADGTPVLVKLSSDLRNPVAQRWRDLLLTEHHALEVLRRHGLDAARTRVHDHGGRRFLEVERFDRCGARGRRGLFSLASMEAEFIGRATEPWPVLVRELARQGHVQNQAAEMAAQLYAFGRLIGNTDMHHGNLSFTTHAGRPYELAPAYDMLCMGFAPLPGGQLPQTLPPLNLPVSVAPHRWRAAFRMATDFMSALRSDARLSRSFAPCFESLSTHLKVAQAQIDRLA